MLENIGSISQDISVKQTDITYRNVIGKGNSFEKLLDDEKIKFSQHAQKRINSRNINFSENDIEKISSAVDKAASKGSRESLLLMENMALVVSVKNRTVITAMDRNNLKENVFTNIDSAVII